MNYQVPIIPIYYRKQPSSCRPPLSVLNTLVVALVYISGTFIRSSLVYRLSISSAGYWSVCVHFNISKHQNGL